MKNILNTILVLVFISYSVSSFAKIENLQDGNSIVICDTSKIYLNDSCTNDTLIGKAVVRLSLENKKCEDPIIKDVQILFLSIILEKDLSKKLFDYRYLVTKKLSKDETKILSFYTDEISKIIETRGVCCLNEVGELDNNKYDFPITFTVIPSN